MEEAWRGKNYVGDWARQGVGVANSEPGRRGAVGCGLPRGKEQQIAADLPQQAKGKPNLLRSRQDGRPLLHPMQVRKQLQLTGGQEGYFPFPRVSTDGADGPGLGLDVSVAWIRATSPRDAGLICPIPAPPHYPSSPTHENPLPPPF